MAQDDEKYDEAFWLLADEVGLSDTKVMVVFGAMRLGATKEEAQQNMDSQRRNMTITSTES